MSEVLTEEVLTEPEIEIKSINGPKDGCIPGAIVRKNLATYKRRFKNAFRHLVALGLEQRHIEVIFGLGQHNFRPVCERTPEIEEARQEAMAILENRLASKMLVNAVGYDYEEEEIEYRKVINTKMGKKGRKGYDTWSPVKKRKYKKHQPGSATLFMSFMTNKFPDNWKISQEIINKKEGYDSDPKLRARKIIESLGRTILEGDTNRPKTECSVPNEPARISDGGQ